MDMNKLLDNFEDQMEKKLSEKRDDLEEEIDRLERRIEELEEEVSINEKYQV